MSQLLRRELFLSLLVLTLANVPASNPLQAADCHEHHGNCDSCKCKPVECTIMVPVMVTETRIKTRVIKVKEFREETYTVFKKVPVEREFKKKECFLEHQVKTKTVTDKKCATVMVPLTKEVKVPVPVTKIKQGLEEQEICGKDGMECVEVPYEREVTVLEYERKEIECEKPVVVFPETKREINYCVKVPKHREKVCWTEKTFELVPVEQTRTVCVYVPKVEKIPVDEVVCRMVPKTVYRCQCDCGQDK